MVALRVVVTANLSQPDHREHLKSQPLIRPAPAKSVNGSLTFMQTLFRVLCAIHAPPFPHIW